MRKIVFFTVLSLYACKKDKPPPQVLDPIVSPITGSRFDLTKDSIFLYAKQIYLWADVLPSYTDFDPRSRYLNTLSERSAVQQELFDITQFKINPQTNKPYEYPIQAHTSKYSFLTESENISGLMLASGATVGQAVLYRNTLAHPNRKIGYIALGAFPKLGESKTAFDEAFDFLSQKSIEELIIDLRSNSGGYVETAEYLANLLSPSHLKGKLMFSQVFNKRMQEGKATILAYQPYLDQNGNTVNYHGRLATLADIDYSLAANTRYFAPVARLKKLGKVFFITSVQTSSAAELLISILKPYLDVHIVGEKSYGKPVGFFGIHIDRYSLFLTSFHLLNAEGWNNYFDGMLPTMPTAVALHPASWGDPNDSAINAILTGQIADHTVQEQSFKSSRTNEQPQAIPVPIMMQSLKLHLKQ